MGGGSGSGYAAGARAVTKAPRAQITIVPAATRSTSMRAAPMFERRALPIGRDKRMGEDQDAHVA